MKKIIRLFYYIVHDMTCPKCGYVMTQGASHSGQGTQWECHNCGKTISN